MLPMRPDASLARGPARVSLLHDPARLAAIVILVVCGAAIVTWIVARGDLVGADARAYWGGARLWLAGGDPLDPPPPYLPYVYWPWSLPLFTPWAALPWETAWFVYRVFNVVIFVWSAAWAYRQHPLATAVLVAVVTIPLATTLDTGNITLLCAMAVWAAYFVGPRLGGLAWALAAALKWFPLLLFLILPPRARLWGIAWGVLFGVLTLAVWPEVVRQLELAIDFPRPLRLDYLLLLWAAVPWVWSHPRWFEWRTWPEQGRHGRDHVVSVLATWWRSPRRLGSLWDAGWRLARAGLGLSADPLTPHATASPPGSGGTSTASSAAGPSERSG
jgi:hypothetical protein